MKLRVTHQAAFTMMEIAIAIGVIAFAIIGVLPSGMQVQRDNREETLIQQDATYLLEAMRGTAQNIPDLHTFIDTLNGQPSPFSNSLDVVRALMSRDGSPNPNDIYSTNLYVFRAITGPTVMRAAGVPTFRYMVRSLVTNSAVNTNSAYGTELEKNTFDVRLTFLWPVLPNGELADPAQKVVMRTVVSGSWDGGNRFTSSDFP
jgi:type II secretory pathway pseudopilin PulG